MYISNFDLCSWQNTSNNQVYFSDKEVLKWPVFDYRNFTRPNARYVYVYVCVCVCVCVCVLYVAMLRMFATSEHAYSYVVRLHVYDIMSH